MRISKTIEGREEAIARLFTDAFTAAEGATEGALVGKLARALLRTTPAGDLHAFTAETDSGLIAAVLFTSLGCADDPRRVVLLSPMAVAPGHQRRGLGQALLRAALADLREGGVDIVMTYGDPAFYGKLGFRPVPEETLPAPLPLSRPEGWIGLPLSEERIRPLKGRCTCAQALNDPAIW